MGPPQPPTRGADTDQTPGPPSAGCGEPARGEATAVSPALLVPSTAIRTVLTPGGWETLRHASPIPGTESSSPGRVCSPSDKTELVIHGAERASGMPVSS